VVEAIGSKPGGRALQLLGPSAGGIKRHVAALAGGLAEAGWSSHVAGPAGVMSGLGPQDHVVPVAMSPGAVLRGRRALAEVVRDVDVVHAHGLKAGWLASTVKAARPLVVTVHNLVLDEAAGRSAAVLRFLEARLPRRADAVIAVSPEIAERFAGLPGADRVRVVRPVGPPPVPQRAPDQVRADLDVPPDAPLVVCVARLHPQKDLPTLFRAAAELRSTRPELVVVVVGEGPDEAALQGLIGELDLDGTVRLIGPRPQAADEIAAADALVVSSLWESGPLVVAEALELGRPVVSTPVGFVPELIEDGTSGRLVPVGDAVALAKALGEVLADPAAAAAMGAAGQQAVRRELGAQRLAAEVAAVYDEVRAR
jgi:glycosyltransferase involved in cell wall biosynthesis